MAGLGLGLVALVVTGATGLSIVPRTGESLSDCEAYPSESWADHIASRLQHMKATYANVMVLPAHKLAFCRIPKVASEHFGRLFSQLNGVPPGTAGEITDSSSLAYQNVSLSDISRGNGWKFALFARNPLERYLSAFLSKCVPGRHTSPVPANCGRFCDGPTRTQPVSAEEMVSLFEERVQFDAKHGLPGTNEHWQSQTSIIETHCDLPGVNWFDADYVGRITRDTTVVNEQVQEMLHRLTSVKSIPRAVAPQFPRTSSLLLCNHQHCSEASEQFDLFYRKNSTVRAVMKVMADDYGNRAKLHLSPLH